MGPAIIVGILLVILAGYLLLDLPDRKESTGEQSANDLAIATDLTKTPAAITAVTLTQVSEPSPVVQTIVPQDIVVPAKTLQPATTPLPSKMAVSATNTPHPTYTPLPTYTPQPTHTPVPNPTTIAAYFTRPTERNWQDVESVWKKTGFEDMQSPGTKLYSIAVYPGDVLRWSFSWCATDDARLREILAPLTVEMLVDGSPLPSSQILQHNVTAADGWECRYWSTILDGWRSGTVVDLDVDYTLTTPIFDGTARYSPGSYNQIIQVAVR